jgi:hypothetical protein
MDHLTHSGHGSSFAKRVVTPSDARFGELRSQFYLAHRDRGGISPNLSGRIFRPRLSSVGGAQQTS